MALVTMKELLEAGVHFGHQTRRWNPKMKRYIYHERNGIYIIDLHQTLRLLEDAYHFVRQTAAEGKQILFVGTKRQAQESIKTQAERCGMPYVNRRWLGGMLTNIRTMRDRIKYLENLEAAQASGEWTRLTKKEGLTLERELEKLQANLGGYRNAKEVPGAVFIVDLKREHLAAAEANKLGVPVVSILDTNCDPDLVDWVIPGNDDAIRAIRLITGKMADAVLEGKAERESRMAEEAARLETVAADAELPEDESLEGPVWSGAVEDQFIENAFDDIYVDDSED
ncbi:MAG: 30S ribosomal protein S2 [Armatimonadetes bacterium]|nr:30S ribosomal protein S2 [Armatimonadota bacterium]